MFFFEKKNQKTFIRAFGPGGTISAGIRNGAAGAEGMGKVFFASFFFRKKKSLPFSSSPYDEC